ncbi:uncharacterized protein LOC119371913 isoform X1 [Rhipicephalus sanguineus]|uniref:uncharacterized protein LOC119371913 isoform X1 n=1 Tax=Rhipicephalus sanguineus TaxID=34632 RepID=UPI0020C3CF22|nr:uncharacterized protein LOC119371913 isoform X1 [Rhipicephalus sanguineus]
MSNKPKAKGRYKQSCCFVPYCRSGYRSNLKRASLFRAPLDPVRLSEWEESIGRTDKKLTSSAVVCERHFEESCIERTFRIVIDGVVNEIPREAPLLKRDAVPTVFEDYAICSNRKFPCRKLVSVVREQERAHESSERRNGGNCTSESRLDVDAVSDSQDDVDFTGEAALSSAESGDVECTGESGDDECAGSVEEESAACDEEASEDGSTARPSTARPVAHAFEDIQIPSTWARVPCLGEGSLAYARCEMQVNNFSCLFIERMVVFGTVSADDGSVTATVYMRGRESFKEVLRTRCEAEEFIKDINAVSLCEGCGVKPTSTKFASYRDMYFAEKCLIIAGAKGESCVRCQHVRKLMQGQMGKQKSEGISTLPET